MVAIKQKFPYLEDGSIDGKIWLQTATKKYKLKNTDLLLKALVIADNAGKGLTTFYGQPCIEQGLEMAEIILDLGLDQDAAAAATLASIRRPDALNYELIKHELNENIAELVQNFTQMNVINHLSITSKTRDQTQSDRFRKALLAMVSDIRVVLIKLSERTCMMRGIKKINISERKRLAQETMDIYAPLANWLGIGQLKWELEDLAFHYIDPETYKAITKFLAEQRDDRERRIQKLVDILKENFAEAKIHAEIYGRAKHIYSIYMKMQRKQSTYEKIYDYNAIRILADNIENCYASLSIVHRLWEPIAEEFDDYIANPKPNGYRSIHTAVKGPGGINLEIQIRSRDMHTEAEHGIAAHWVYKEQQPQQTGHENKINFLRQLLAWHKEVAQDNNIADKKQAEILADRVYVFTPDGDIIDMPVGATPLDFAYHIHSELGHRCRGAKINGHIVPLTHPLKTGDQVDIITIKSGTPSRDWLNKDLGYLKTSRARAKVSQWFKLQDWQKNIEDGKHIIEREFHRAAITHANLKKIAERFNFNEEEALFAALGRGTIKANQVLHALHAMQGTAPVVAPAAVHPTKKPVPSSGLQIAGISDLLTRIAKCCKPIPGDEIIGYITQGRGISIHKKICNNVSHLSPDNLNRLMQVTWDPHHPGSYYVDLIISAQNHENSLGEITSLLANIKVDLITLNSSVNRKTNKILITLTTQLTNLNQLQELLHQLQHLPHVLEVKRLNGQ